MNFTALLKTWLVPKEKAIMPFDVVIAHNTDRAKSRIISSLLLFCKYLSNYKIIENSWLRGKGPLAGSFDETMCGIFDDCELRKIVKHWQDWNLSKAQFKTLKRFCIALDRYSDSMNDYRIDEIFIDPKWYKIERLARSVVDIFEKDRSWKVPEYTINEGGGMTSSNFCEDYEKNIIRFGKEPGAFGYHELVNFKQRIGYAVNAKTGARFPTSWGKIHYGKNGTHIVPTYPRYEKSTLSHLFKIKDEIHRFATGTPLLQILRGMGKPARPFDDPVSGLLSMKRAFLGMITPSLRAVTVNLDFVEKTFFSHFYYDGTVTDDLLDLTSYALCEASDCWNCMDVIIQWDAPKPIPLHTHFAYLRRELGRVPPKIAFLPRSADCPIKSYAAYALQQGLLSRTVPSLRSALIAADENTETLHFYFYYDKPILEELRSLSQEAADAARRAFSEKYKYFINIEYLSDSDPYPKIDASPVYVRWEKS